MRNEIGNNAPSKPRRNINSNPKPKMYDIYNDVKI